MMFQKLALAATAVAFLAAVPAEAAMHGPPAGGPHYNYAASHAIPAKAKKKHVFHVKKKVCHPVYKWRTVWWHGRPHKAKVRTGYKCTWKWVPIWRWR